VLLIFNLVLVGSQYAVAGVNAGRDHHCRVPLTLQSNRSTYLQPGQVKIN
jgi:hypothetical protein